MDGLIRGDAVLHIGMSKHAGRSSLTNSMQATHDWVGRLNRPAQDPAHTPTYPNRRHAGHTSNNFIPNYWTF